MRAGASDFLVKPLAPDRLLAALDAATDRRRKSGELRPLSEKIGKALGFEEIVGSAPQFRAALAVAAKAARARVSVLIEGESGSGKEIIAQAIHAASPRGKKPLHTVNCGAIPANLVESVLFGHEKGSFTGAFDRHIGRFEDADGSTLFLDEVGELPLDTQVKLLRALETGEIQRVGSRITQTVDVRIIAATNRRLADEVAAGRFREDLYYRLNVVHVPIPPLRDRHQRHPRRSPATCSSRIAEQPGMRHLSITDDALAVLMSYGWPGNVRQLQNALFRAAVLCESDALTAADFPHIATEAACGQPRRRLSRQARSNGQSADRRARPRPRHHPLSVRRQSAPARGDRGRRHPPRHRPLSRPHDRSRAPPRDRPLDALPQARRARHRRHRRLGWTASRKAGLVSPFRSPEGDRLLAEDAPRRRRPKARKPDRRQRLS